MNGEISLFGIYMPSLLLLALIALIVTRIVIRLADVTGFYRFVAYRALVDLCLFIMVLGALALLFPHVGFRP